LQRSGRLHRHREREYGPVLSVLLPAVGATAFGGTGHVYEAKPLLRTVAILGATPGQCEIRLPNDFRDLIGRCYGSSEWDQHAVPWDVVRQADVKWDEDTRCLESQGRQFALREPRSRAFLPMGNDPTGDDSDDGTGWRAKTRLGAADRTAVLVADSECSRLAPGDLSMHDIRALYQRSVKLPGYLPVDRPSEGHSAGVEAEGRLHGLLLLPTDTAGHWRGIDERGGRFDVHYDYSLGLLVGRGL
jgi:hypothetical protein